MYGGQSTHIPIKVAMSGVMPIIFAMSLPKTICFFGVDGKGDSFWDGFVRFFSQTSDVYATIYFVLIIAFNYFYVAITYNPAEIANNLKKNNGAILGYRLGKPTSDFIYNSLNKITLIDAIFLGVIAIFPIILYWINSYHIEYKLTKVVQRIDVKPEMVQVRLKTYHEKTASLKDYYQSRGKFVTVQGQNDIAETSKLVLAAIKV